MLIIFQWLFNLIIIISPIFGFFPQIIKVIKNKTDEGFNTSRVTLTYCSIFMEMLLNFSFNQSNNYSYKNLIEDKYFCKVLPLVSTALSLTGSYCDEHRAPLHRRLLGHGLIMHGRLLVLSHAIIFAIAGGDR